MQYREVNICGCALLSDQVRLNLNGRIDAAFVDVAQKVLQQLKLHKVQHHHLEEPLGGKSFVMSAPSLQIQRAHLH